MLTITDHIRIPDEEFALSFARAGGPGGQNVNKVSSKVLLRWHPAASPSLPEEVKARLLAQQRHRLTRDGELLITSQRFRDQAKNIADCREKLRELVLRAVHPPKPRKATRPSRGSHERRHAAKRHRSQVKGGRRKVSEE
jgi:ribosome-associated protein